MGDRRLADRVALVTGAGAGLGQAVAVGLAGAGARVGILEVDPERIDQTAEMVRRAGGEALSLPTDVMDADMVRASVARAAGHFGRIDILVNNAGGVNGRRFLAQSERSWRRHIDINLVSMLVATAATAPVMIEGGRGGAILNITSIEGLRAAPMYAVYAACKAGMISFTKSMALELGEHGIRVNALAPDHTATAGLRGIMTGAVDPANLPPRAPAERDGVNAYVPLGREGNAPELAKVAVFLCSDDAGYVTGATLNVDGGTFAASGWTRAADGNWSLYGADVAMPTVGRSQP
jgi:NAD(P)-dependent dehydrogenase (short-subunit alcohol dehydrogenase family)